MSLRMLAVATSRSMLTAVTRASSLANITKPWSQGGRCLFIKEKEKEKKIKKFPEKFNLNF